MRAAILILVLALAPLTAAQHEHGTGEAKVVIAHDGPPGGRAVVGDVTHFAAILFGEDGAPQFHHDMRVEVRLNGAVLWATTPESGHDYDGINDVDIVFPVPGHYVVSVTATGKEGDTTGTYEGDVVAMRDPVAASLELQAPERAVAYEPATFTYSVVDAQGRLLPHTDVLFEVRRADGFVEFRVHTHSHMEEQSLRYAFTKPGEHTVTLLAYTAFPTADAKDFAAFTTTRKVTVESGSPLPPGLPALAMPNPKRNDVGMGESSGDYVVMTAYDPYTTVGPFSQVRLSTVVADQGTLEPVQHINFEAKLTDGYGRELFSSQSLHEYDGVFDVLAGGQDIGPYTLEVAGVQGAWKGSAKLEYTVAPPLAPLSAGPQFVEVQGLDRLASGAAGEVALVAHDLAGMPFMHSEVDVQVLRQGEGQPPLVATKLHTHDDGRFPFTLTLPEEGDYVLRLAPFSLEPRPTPVFYGEELGAPLDIPFKVGAGPGLPGPQPLGATGGPAAARTPGFEALALVGAAVATALLAPRRRP